jgi:hypothetical protein
VSEPSLSLTHQCGGVTVIESWDITTDLAVGIRALLGEPVARTEIPDEVAKYAPNSIMGGEWTTWRDDADGVQ